MNWTTDTQHNIRGKKGEKKTMELWIRSRVLSELTIAHLVTVAAVFKMFKRFKWNRKKKFVIFVRHFFRRIKINSSFAFHRNMWHCFYIFFTIYNISRLWARNYLTDDCLIFSFHYANQPFSNQTIDNSTDRLILIEEYHFNGKPSSCSLTLIF